MLRLMKLELRQNRFRVYLLASLGIAAGLLGFIYLFAALPHLKAKSELEAKVMELVGSLFGNYENIIALACILSMFCFSILCSTMLSRFVVSDYTGKRANLLFAYPVNRGKLFLSKALLTFLFTIMAMLISNALLFGIFFFSESKLSLVAGAALSTRVILSTLKITIIFSFIAGAIGLISLWFGFKRKSVAATLIPTYILAAVCSNILGPTMLFGSTLDNTALQTGIAGITLLIGIVLTINLMGNVNTMEAA